MGTRPSANTNKLTKYQNIVNFVKYLDKEQNT